MPATSEPVAELAAPVRSSRFTQCAWFVLGWNLFVVVWGAYVRASGSGAGCGSHWPLCNGQVVPRAPRLETIIEFTHRITSGIALISAGALAIWSFRQFPRGHRVRAMSLLAVVFLFAEALLGAGLVLFKFVASNASAGRAVYLALHLVNTQFLLAALALTAWYSRSPMQMSARRSTLVTSVLPVAILVSVAGAIAALGDTLFPASSITQGFKQDISGTAHFLLRLRVLHPMLAILGGAWFIFIATRVLKWRPQRTTARIAVAVIALSLVQLGAGGINLAMLAPIPMQLVHLFLADLLWLSLVLLAVEAKAS